MLQKSKKNFLLLKVIFLKITLLSITNSSCFWDSIINMESIKKIIEEGKINIVATVTDGKENIVGLIDKQGSNFEKKIVGAHLVACA